MTAAAIPLPAEAYVYVIGADDGPQKIGIANDPESRRSLFQTGNHALLKVAAAAPVSRKEAGIVERYAHWLLRDQRVRGEWFNVSPDEARQAIDDAVRAVRERKELPFKTSGRSAIGTRFAPEVRKIIEEEAAADNRAASHWIEKVVLDHLKAKGRLPK